MTQYRTLTFVIGDDHKLMLEKLVKKHDTDQSKLLRKLIRQAMDVMEKAEELKNMHYNLPGSEDPMDLF